MRKLFFICLVLFNFVLFGQTVVPIVDLRMNDASGIPVGNGSMFTVSGVVTAGNHFGASGPGAIQDLTAGISVYGSAFVNQVQIGDSVTVTAQLVHFNGLTQLDFTKPGASVIKHKSGVAVQPVIVTIAQIIAQTWNGVEEIESELIRVNNVTINGTGNFSGGTSGYNYTISDPTGSLAIRIDESVNIVGTPIPSGTVDMIGILSQYKFAAPYNSGYQIMPRFVNDIIDDGSPVVLNPIVASNIDSVSFIVFFSTIRPGNSQVKYGLTPSLELDSVIVNGDTTFHRVPITGLQPFTTYYFKAYSRNSVGISSSSLQSVITTAANSTSGNINVYFNFGVDTTVAIPGNNANGLVNFPTKLIERINAATYSIDLALYSFFGLSDVANALITAKNRGVKVRFVYDSRTNQNNAASIINAGIPYIKRPSSLSGIMHNKFFVFDARDTNPNNDWVWTGSWNITSSELNWKNNVIEINDPAVALAYTNEFQEMWGSSTDTPNPSNAKFGSQKSDNTQHSFTVGGRNLKVYFSPSDNTNSKIIDVVNTSNNNIYFALYSFTKSDIRQAMYNRNQLGVSDIRGIIDQANGTGSQFTQLQSFAQMFTTVSSGTVHHKYGMVDVTNPLSDPTVLTGSHNWSGNAETDNDENTVIITDIYIANQYMQEFKARYNEDGGTSPFTVPVVSVEDEISEIKDFSLHQNYPNPFNPSTVISYSLPASNFVTLKIFDILGNEITTLLNSEQSAGKYSISYNASHLSSGVYFYRLNAGEFSSTRKMLLTK